MRLALLLLLPCAARAYDPVIAAQMDAEDEEKNKPGGEYDIEIREALLAAGFPYEEGDLVPEPYENIEPEPCLSIASVTLQLDTEVVLGFRDSFTDDVGDVIDLVDERKLTSGGHCEDDPACVAGVILDRIRNVREAMERLQRGWWDEPFFMKAAYNNTQLQVNATIDDLFIDGLRAIKAHVCFALSDKTEADACVPISQESYEVPFLATVQGASPGAHTVYAWMEAQGADDECRDLLRRDRLTIEYFVPAWTNSYWEPFRNYTIKSYIGYEVRIVQGKGTYGMDGVRILAYGGSEKLVVGNFSSIGPGVSILLGGEHRYGWMSTFPFPAFDPRAAALTDKHASSKGDVVIGSDVFVGADAKILSGVSIGNGAVIGAAAVVAKNVRPYAIVVGNPAKEIKRRFDDATVQRLLDQAWWTWDDVDIVANFEKLMAPPV